MIKRDTSILNTGISYLNTDYCISNTDISYFKYRYKYFLHTIVSYIYL